MFYAIHSEKMARLTGEVEYSTPSGGTVIVTQVSLQPGCPECAWDDKRDLGEVVKFLRRISPRSFRYGFDGSVMTGYRP